MAKKATATKKAPAAKKSAKQPRATVMVCLTTTTAAAVPTVKILANSLWGSTLSVPPGTPVTVMGFASAGLMSSGLSAVLISVDDDTVTAPVSGQPAPVTGKKTRWQASFTMPSGDWIFEVSGTLSSVTYTDDLEFRST